MLLRDGTARADIVASVRRRDVSSAHQQPRASSATHDDSVSSVQRHDHHLQHQQQRAQSDTPRRDGDSDGPSFYFQFGGGSLGEADELSVGGGAVSIWTPVTITQTRVRIALDAVRYRNNYESYITTRLCLHRVNLIRRRMVTDALASYLFSVDGCESSKIAVSGRCDIYYCKLATYELKVTQKTPKKDIYIVQSIFKALTQKTMSELMQATNLDVTDDDNDDSGDTGDDGNAGDTKERVRANVSVALNASAAVAQKLKNDAPRALRADAVLQSSRTT